MGNFITLESRISYKIQKVELHESNLLELIINIDGFSPFKSSNLAIWPILVKVHAKDHQCYKPFSASVYAGNGKPKSSEEYLKKFVYEMQELMSDGITIKTQHYEVKIKFFCCDTPARSSIKCVVSHVAFHGCERCRVVGKKVNGVTVFIGVDHEKRTDDDFRNFVDAQSHTGVSLLHLLDPSINFVSQFVLDPMHLLYLGCTKRILEYLLQPSKHKIRLSGVKKNELERLSVQIHSNIPEEFPRKLRSTKDWSKYKAVEYKFFILYAAPVILKKLLSTDLYNHLMLFVVSCRLMSSENPLVHVPVARQYLKCFVEKSPDFFGETFMSLNIHNLIHICDDVENMKLNFNELSAFCFESYLGKMSSALRSPTHIVSQYCRRLQEQEMFDEEMPSNIPETLILQERKSEIIKVKYRGMILSSRNPNSTIFLNDKCS